jgi:hypothetical protein
VQFLIEQLEAGRSEALTAFLDAMVLALLLLVAKLPLLAVVPVVIAAVFMGASSCTCCLCFHAVRGMYLHAAMRGSE